MFIQTEETPNPATLKFIPGRDVLPGGTRDFRSADEADVSPLATRIFAIDGVSGVFLGHDFVTVTREDAEWPHIKPAVLGAIMEHYLSGAPVLDEGSTEDCRRCELRRGGLRDGRGHQGADRDARAAGGRQ